MYIWRRQTVGQLAPPVARLWWTVIWIAQLRRSQSILHPEMAVCPIQLSGSMRGFRLTLPGLGLSPPPCHDFHQGMRDGLPRSWWWWTNGDFSLPRLINHDVPCKEPTQLEFLYHSPRLIFSNYLVSVRSVYGSALARLSRLRCTLVENLGMPIQPGLAFDKLRPR